MRESTGRQVALRFGPGLESLYGSEEDLQPGHAATSQQPEPLVALYCYYCYYSYYCYYHYHYDDDYHYHYDYDKLLLLPLPLRLLLLLLLQRQCLPTLRRLRSSRPVFFPLRSVGLPSYEGHLRKAWGRSLKRQLGAETLSKPVSGLVLNLAVLDTTIA